jgi:hypothetical protein
MAWEWGASVLLTAMAGPLNIEIFPFHDTIAFPRAGDSRNDEIITLRLGDFIKWLN